MSSATRKCAKREAKIQALTFGAADTQAARKEKLRMVTNAQWKNRNPSPGRGPKSLYKPGNQSTQSVFGNRRNPVVTSL